MKMFTICKNISVVKADITTLKVDAIVNAANQSLMGGGGVDGAIHRAAGVGLREETSKLGGCPTGEAKLTLGHNLPAKHIIHTVGPVWHGGHNLEHRLLSNCYKRCFELALEHNIRTIAFPSISTGVFGYPISKASKIAIEETNIFLKDHSDKIAEVFFVCFSDNDLSVYTNLKSDI